MCRLMNKTALGLISFANILLKLDIPVLLRVFWLNSQTLYVFLYFKVKQYDAFKGDYVKGENFSSESLSPNVLAQHGIQLLMERECSFFFPAGIVGILCIGTKVGFKRCEDFLHYFWKAKVILKTFQVGWL